MENLEKTITLDYKTFRHFNYNHMTRWSSFRKVIIMALFPTLFLVGILQLISKVKGPEFFDITIYSIITGACLTFFVFYIIRFKSIKKIFESNKIMQEPADFTFSADGINVKNESSERTIFWQDIHAVQESKTVIAIYLNRLQAHILPKALFTSSEISELRKLFKYHIDKRRLNLNGGK